MIRTEVINLRDAPSHWGSDPRYVYIGRTGPLGNPVRRNQRCAYCGQVHRLPGETLLCFEHHYLRPRLARDADFAALVRSLHGMILVCHCAPNPCHGHVYARVAAELCGAPLPKE